MNDKIMAVEYISSIVREIKNIAEIHKLETLAYILSIALQDATEIMSELADKNRTPP
ncbi:hypothetical protein ACT6QG_00320 [Xanthobacter sp. TB0136]|uniref:hypothetical protein n=1 Tax=Xanthobacter sp. TB0136 TaxID=3459177 RepID=UPI004039A76C